MGEGGRLQLYRKRPLVHQGCNPGHCPVIGVCATHGLLAPPPNAAQAITNLTGAPVECASLPPAWQVQRSWINDQASRADSLNAGAGSVVRSAAHPKRCAARVRRTGQAHSSSLAHGCLVVG